MKSILSALLSGSFFRRRHADTLLLSAVLLPLALVSQAHGQAPAIRYVPTISTYAGGANAAGICANAKDSHGDGCPATQATLSGQSAVESDAAGNLYFTEANDFVVRRVDAMTGLISLVAGQYYTTSTPMPAVCSGATGTTETVIWGDGCPAMQADFSNPRAARFDAFGNLMIADAFNDVIRRIDKKTGIVTLVEGTYLANLRTPPKNTQPVAPLALGMYLPYDIAFDPAGNMTLVNSKSNFNPITLATNGVIDPSTSLVYDNSGTGAGSSSPAANGNGGLATSATFNNPRAVALDAAGNTYIADYTNNQIRRVSSARVNGQVTPAGIAAATIVGFAGTGTAGSTGDGGLATAAEIALPQSVGLDNAGNVYIGENGTGNQRVRVVNPTTGIINTYAGNGTTGFTGDGGAAALAEVNNPIGINFNLGGRMTLSDFSNNRLRNIYPVPFFSANPAGTTSAVQNAIIQANAAATLTAAAVSNSEFILGGASGCTLGKAMASGAYCTFPLKFNPAGPGLRAGQLKITDSNGNVYNDSLIGVGLAPAAAFYGAPINTLAGNGTAGNSGNSGAASSALINAPRSGAFDSFGNFYFADSGNNVIREISKTGGIISVVAGNGTAGFSGDGAAATSSMLNAPTGIAIDPAGNIYIADAGNNRIREVAADTGIITTVAGTGASGYTGDTGLATAATLNNPTGIAIDNAGSLYIADTGNNVLRAFNPNNGVMVTLAGNGTPGYSGDGAMSQLAELNAPTAVTVDLAGNIYVADTGNGVVRQIVPVAFGIINFRANISTYAGIPGANANSGDGGVATAAGLLAPSGVGVDAAGDLYIAAGGQVRMVNTSGTITTLAGTGASGTYSGDNGSALSAVLPSPAQDLAVDQVGNIYLSDTAANRIVTISGSQAAALAFGNQAIATSSTPQTVTLYNSGNQPLYITNIATPSGYSLSSSGFAACSGTTVLAPSASCTFTVVFSPATTTVYNGQITITDNALNSVTGTQTISLTGTGVAHLNETTTAVTYTPSSLIYGGAVALTATVSGGANVSGTVNFVINSRTTVSAPLVSGQATYQLTGLPAGPASITANYLGDSVNSSSAGSVALTVQPAVLTVAANSFSKYPTQDNPTFTATITGLVNNDTLAKAVSGAPAFSTTATTTSVAGSYPITVLQGTLTAPNYTFVFVPGTLTVLPATFSLSVSSTSLTIPSGQVGAVIVTVTPSAGYNGTINLSCGTLPANVTCNFNTNSLLVDPSGPQSTQLTISATNLPQVASLERDNDIRKEHQLISFAAGLPLLSLAMLFGGNARRRRALGSLLAALLLAVTLQVITGCASVTQTATPFTGNIVITASDKAASISVPVTIGLTVK